MEYRKEKREYKELCETKKREENERWERKVEGARNESQVWEIVNGERKRRKGINKGIEMKEWEGYFKELLGGVEGRMIRGKGKRRKQGWERDLSREEIRRATRNLKDGKAMGIDGIPNKVWKYEGEMEEWVWKVCNEIWMGGWSKEWKEGVVVPVRKKEQGEEVRDYREISIMPTLYKVYTAVLSERLRDEVEADKE
ncbi:PREDICTED: uncharacterized protein LOC108759461 [Trachymyrmex cornetzi]|uniref:uncharacterized protein LOC108759461 n=1 Tax=Trachymyrmex cornetzi TaxID=471704 RepID=UPI00084F6EB8|nr:PREDICTED: uncharacterized protein LOC108759461 [Trachymyrmex cornetzi]